MTRRAYGSSGGGSGGGAGAANYYGPYSGRPGAGVVGRIAYYTDSPVPQVDTGVAWRNIIGMGVTMPEPEVPATERNIGSATITKVANILEITPQASVLAARAWTNAFSGALTSFRIRAAFAGGSSTAINGAAGYNDSGSWCTIYARAASGATVTYGPRRTTGGDIVNRNVWTSSGATYVGNASSVASTFARTWTGGGNTPIYEVRAEGTNIQYNFSIDGGRTFLNWTHETLASPGLSLGVTDWGFGVDTITASGTVARCYCYGIEAFETA